MQKPLAFATTALIIIACLSAVASAELSVGVKQGNWIQYSVSYTGTPMQGHDVTWARMEILAVATPNIDVVITSRFSDGSMETTNYTLNLETGHLIDSFIIPANLKAGDTFKDENLGTVTLDKAEIRQYAGNTRTVVSASVGNNTYVWDQATGVSVEGASQTAEYTITTVVSSTNMWQPSEVNWASIFLAAAVLLIVVFAVAAVVAHYQRKRACAKRKRSS